MERVDKYSDRMYGACGIENLEASAEGRTTNAAAELGENAPASCRVSERSVRHHELSGRETDEG